MPAAMNNVFKEGCNEVARQVVAKLAEKYKFDADEELRLLSLDETKVQSSRGKSKSDKAPKKVSKKASKKAGSDSDGETKSKVKRGPTGYLLFGNSIRAEITAELAKDLDEGKKVAQSDVTKIIGTRWAETKANDEASAWNDKAKAIKDDAKSASDSD